MTNLFKTIVIAVFSVLLTHSVTANPTKDSSNKNSASADKKPSASAGALNGDAAAGKVIFETKCATCHKVYGNSTGPELHGVVGRHSSIDWLKKWIRNNIGLTNSGDAEAVKTSAINSSVMSVFETISDEEIINILTYVETAPKPPGPQLSATGVKDESGNPLLLLLIAVILLAVLFILNKVRNNLKRVEAEKLGAHALDAIDNKLPWYEAIMPKKWRMMNRTVFIMFGLSVGALLFTWWFFVYGTTEVGVQKGYAPTQPINFSHKLHAGDMAIDCKYCHSTVEVSKNASIPALNTCMNCHKGVQNKKDQPGVSPEIAKIYKALDYDPEKSTDAYGKNPSAVRWVRIHNLPDHAYFNHSQHVKVGKLECQTCHGPVERMEKVQQWNTLQMGWCIDCHRTRNIDAANNNYYLSLHQKAKDDMQKNGNSKYFKDGKLSITPAMNGGLECSKCHY